MAISLLHDFQSAKGDGLDTTVVQPSDWNAEHVLEMATGKVLGRSTAGTGPAEELPSTTFGRSLFNLADEAALRALITDYLLPSGVINDYAGAAAPSGWLMCYGQAIDRTTYASLFTAIGTTYGVGNGTTTFNLPDHRGRVAAGKDDMGGSSANRLTNQTGGLNGDTLGATGGAETHVLTSAQLAAHTHTFTGSALAAHGHPFRVEHSGGQNSDATGGFMLSSTNDQNDAAFTGTPTATAGQQIGGQSAGTPAGTNSSTGSDTAHNNVQPTIVFNKIIKI